MVVCVHHRIEFIAIARAWIDCAITVTLPTVDMKTILIKSRVGRLHMRFFQPFIVLDCHFKMERVVWFRKTAPGLA